MVDTTEFTTPVESLDVALFALDRATVLRAQPDRAGRFVLNDVLPGRYAFEFSFPARFVSVMLGAKPVSLPIFELSANDHGPLEITVSMKDAILSADLRGVPGDGAEVVAVLSPADPHLTLAHSCSVNPVKGARTEFRFVPPGTYRLFVVDQAQASEVAGYAPRIPEFLKEQAPPIVVSEDGETRVTVDYIDAATVAEAVKLAGPIKP